MENRRRHQEPAVADNRTDEGDNVLRSLRSELREVRIQLRRTLDLVERLDDRLATASRCLVCNDLVQFLTLPRCGHVVCWEHLHALLGGRYGHHDCRTCRQRALQTRPREYLSDHRPYRPGALASRDRRRRDGEHSGLQDRQQRYSGEGAAMAESEAEALAQPGFIDRDAPDALDLPNFGQSWTA